jgi:hypothetical protein
MEALGFIKEQMNILAVPYEFAEWTSDVKYPYFVGEIVEEPTNTEDRREESTLILTGFTRGKYIELEEIKEKIKKHFDPIYGLRGDIDGGAIAVFFNGSMNFSTGEADLKKIQINLQIIEWKGKW